MMSIIRNYDSFPYNQDIYEKVLSWIQEKNFTKVKPYGGVLFNKWVCDENIWDGWVQGYLANLPSNKANF